MNRRFLRGFSTSMVVFVVVITVMYGWFAWEQATNGIETEAIIIDREVGKTVTLTVEFTTDDGERMRTDFREYSNPQAHVVGETMRIRYVPRDPRIARQVEEPALDPSFVVIVVPMLVLCTGLAVYAWWFAPANKGKAGPKAV